MMAQVNSRPVLRPGVVVHDPSENVDGLLAEFALRLRDRGFKVGGLVQQNNQCGEQLGHGCRDNVEVFDLGKSAYASVARDQMDQYLARNLPKSADLVVLGRFASGGDAIEGLSQSPLLTSISGRCIGKWQRKMHQNGVMLLPQMASLWEWWGAEHVYADLAQGIADDPIIRIVLGPRWVMVQGPHGVGLGRLLGNPADLTPRLGKFCKQSLRQLAKLVESWNPLEMAVGMAAINAHYNRFDLNGASGNGVKIFRRVSGQVAVIGSFPGVEDILPGCLMIEANPRPGELPLAAMDRVLPASAAAVVNAGALINRTLPRILELAMHRPVALIGPITPLTPRLFDYGPSLISGLVVSDADGLAAAIRSGALPREFSRFGKVIHLQREITG